MMSQRTSHHHRCRLHQLRQRRPPRRLLLWAPLSEAYWAGLFAEGTMPRKFFVSWSMSSTRSDRTPLPTETTLMLPMS